jgi:hypothetical protein
VKEFKEFSADSPSSMPSAQALEECLAVFTRVRFRVTGSCMGRALPVGTGVVVASRAIREPRVGDIVLARHAGGLFLHRLILAWPWLGGGLRRTKGDRNAWWDPVVADESVIATVVATDGPGEGLLCRARRTASSLAKGLIRRVAGGASRVVA